jgi:hypothetical protein
MLHETELRRYIPVAKWGQYHPWPSVGGLRYLIFNGRINGFDACVVRIGRKILIDESAFFDWIRKQK